MPNRSSATNITDSGISRNIGTQYAVVKYVADNLNLIQKVASEDFDTLIALLEEATDFEGISVETTSSGEASWDPVNKILTVPAVKGDPGQQGIPGPSGQDGVDGVDGLNGINGTNGVDGLDGQDGVNGEEGPPGPKGDKGDKGDSGNSPLAVAAYNQYTKANISTV